MTNYTDSLPEPAKTKMKIYEYIFQFGRLGFNDGVSTLQLLNEFPIGLEKLNSILRDLLRTTPIVFILSRGAYFYMGPRD